METVPTAFGERKSDARTLIPSIKGQSAEAVTIAVRATTVATKARAAH